MTSCQRTRPSSGKDDSVRLFFFFYLCAWQCNIVYEAHVYNAIKDIIINILTKSFNAPLEIYNHSYDYHCEHIYSVLRIIVCFMWSWASPNDESFYLLYRNHISMHFKCICDALLWIIDMGFMGPTTSCPSSLLDFPTPFDLLLTRRWKKKIQLHTGNGYFWRHLVQHGPALPLFLTS